jgi:CheY-like chemotaxis protein
MIIRILNELGYDNITEAADVDSALAKFNLTHPDLILSDFNMPGKSGIDFLEAVRKNPSTAAIPFVLITTVHDKKIIVEAIKHGLQHYILKPVEKKVMAEKLSALVETHHIQPPRIDVKPSHVTMQCNAQATVPPQSDASASVSKIPQDQIDALFDHFFLVFDGEMTIPDYLAWIKEHIVPIMPQNSALKSAEQILDFLRTTSHQGMAAAFTGLEP